MRKILDVILIITLLLGFSIPVMAECTEKLSIDESKLTEAQEWWESEMSMYIHFWDQFTLVELPDHPWFKVFELPGNVYALFEYRQRELVISYLIPGEETALLWDTGLGIGNIRACAEELTDLPIIVLNSHSHPDHIGGNALFDTVMCYNNDLAIRKLTRGVSHEELVDYFPPEAIIDPPEGFSPDTWSTAGKAPTATVEDGQIIDLGNRRLEVMYTPGHNENSIMLIDEENKLLFAGDTWYPGPLYAFLEDSSMPVYIESMKKAEKVIQEKNIQWIYGSHNGIVPGKELFFDTTTFFEDVLAGKYDYTLVNDLRVYRKDDITAVQFPDS